MKYSLTSILVLLNLFVLAQSNPHIVEQYDFINYDANHIQFYNDSSNFNVFFSKLDSAALFGIGKVRVMQIGGSHIQADIWSDQLRKNFIKLAPNLNGGRGFLFPYRLAKTNNPYYYKVTYTGEWKGYRNSVMKHKSTWGVAGITASTTDTISSFKIKFRGDNTPKYDFNSIKVFHDLDSTSYSLKFLADSCYKININHEIGYTEFILQNHLDSIEFEIVKTDSNQTHFNLYGISLDNNNPGIIYNSIGVNGASTKSYLRCELFEKHLPIINPDLVIFCIGINDAYDPDFCQHCYESNYDSLVSYIKKVNPNAAIIFVTNNDSYYKRRYPNKRAELVKESMVELAKKHNAGLWDMYNIMGGLGSIKTWETNKLAKRDKIHLTKKGYILMGNLLYSSIIKSYNNYLKVK